MEHQEDFKYILFPLPLLREIFKKPQNGFRDICYYGIYRTAIAQDINPDNALRQALYCFYRGGLIQNLQRKFSTLEKQKILCSHEDFFDFSGRKFHPEKEIKQIKEHNDPELEKEILEFYALYQIKEVLHIDFNIQFAINNYHQYNKVYNDFIGQPLVMVNTRIMMEYSNNPKSEFEKVLFAAYAGIRSIIGRGKKFTATTQQMIFCRMFGAKNNTELQRILEDKKVKAVYNKYMNRYQKDKIINSLLINNFLSSKIWLNRRLYVSCTLSYEELSESIIDHLNRTNNKIRINKLKIKEVEAKNKILQHLNNNSTLNKPNS